jgi:hypothetical protein
MLMLKAHLGWFDTSFNNLLHILADIYPKGNKVPTNTYRAKKLIRPVAMKLKKFHACPNHCILYQGKYYIGASMRTCRAVRTMARVDTRGMLVVRQMRIMREGQRIRRPRRVPRRSRSYLLRTRKKRVTCRGKV